MPAILVAARLRWALRGDGDGTPHPPTKRHAPSSPRVKYGARGFCSHIRMYTRGAPIPPYKGPPIPWPVFDTPLPNDGSVISSSGTETARRLLLPLRPPNRSARPAQIITGYFFEVTLDRRRSLTLSDAGRLFVKLAPAYFGKDSGLFARALEAAHGYIERFIFSYFYCRH
ncbi:MAG: hypothetical protein BECKG1743F_GA0114225_100826 [Candidatus Kentron sp. G]|nr:MAG: hypothetical protein BECKG1743F_GA0114225_100826 [Candidatus Kentron sp. G]